MFFFAKSKLLITAVWISGSNKIFIDFFEKLDLIGCFTLAQDCRGSESATFFSSAVFERCCLSSLQVLAEGSWGRARRHSFFSPRAGLKATAITRTARGFSRLLVPLWSSTSSPWTLNLMEHATMINLWYEMVRNIKKNKKQNKTKKLPSFHPDTYLVTFHCNYICLLSSSICMESHRYYGQWRHRILELATVSEEHKETVKLALENHPHTVSGTALHS